MTTTRTQLSVRDVHHRVDIGYHLTTVLPDRPVAFTDPGSLNSDLRLLFVTRDGLPAVAAYWLACGWSVYVAGGDRELPRASYQFDEVPGRG